MAVNRKTTGKACSLPAGLAWGEAVNLGITAAGAALMGKLMDIGSMSWENVGYGIMAMLLCASFLGALVAYKKIKRQRLLVCLLSGALYYGTLLLITALFFGGQFQAIGVTALLVLGGSGAAGLLGRQSGRGGKIKKMKVGYR